MSRADLRSGPTGITIAIWGLIALAISLVAVVTIAGPSDVAVSEQVLTAASQVVAAHADSMRGAATGLHIAAAVSTAQRDGLTKEADLMDAEQGQLANLAMILANQARLLGPTPAEHARIDGSVVHTTGNAVVSEAEALAAHAEAMRAHARAIDGLTAGSDTPPISPTLLREQATALTAAASKGTRVGRLLQQAGDQFMRSLGR